MTYEEFWRPLTALYDRREAVAVARLVMEECCRMTFADMLCGRPGDDAMLRPLQQRLLEGEPVQYIIGVAEFGNLRLHVEPGVLIPRPETLELCRLAQEDYRRWQTGRSKPAASGEYAVLDIGTGSGCIACTLALTMTEARVTAWDIAETALRIARQNAERLGARIAIERRDALRPPADHRRWHLVVSNPPYICQSELTAMEARVTEHEPHTALFVPDADPLLFYRHIGRYAATALRPGGSLMVETNERYATAVKRLFTDLGLSGATVHSDQYGKERFVTARTA